MASGKSLEMKAFDEEHSLRNRQKLLCKCGDVWASSTHFTKAGKLRKDVITSPDHTPTGRAGLQIKRVAAHQAAT